MEICSGIILYRFNIERNLIEFFMCTPGGPQWLNRHWWSFPKGHVEENEEIFDAAVREFREETSCKISDDISLYRYLGSVKQNSHKRVHIYCKRYDGEDLSNCSSNECITTYKGKEYKHPEVSDYCWMSINEMESNGVYIPIYRMIEDCVKSNKW